jgi:thiol-disulfide isomerase/thioredoxin
MDVLVHSLLSKYCCLSVSRQCEACLHYLLEHPNSVHACNLVQVAQFDSAAASGEFSGCIESTNNYNTAEFISRCCADVSLLNRTLTRSAFAELHRQYTTRQSTFNIAHRFNADSFVLFGATQSLCRRARRLQGGTKLRQPTVADELQLDSEDFWLDPEFVGLGCRTNRSVRFYAMDRRSVYGLAFEQSLLGSSSSFDNAGLKRTLPLVVLVDVADQATHVMSGKFSHRNLAGLVMNYTTSSLAPFHRSSPTPTPPSHEPMSDASDINDSRVYVVEVTSANFNAVVMDPTKDVLLFYYAPWCGFCSSVAHVYLMLAHHFRSMHHMVFARLNGDSDDLPWKFRVSRYPSLVYFPAADKAESTVFPPHRELTLPNLVRFVWHVTGPMSNVVVCSQPCIRTNLQSTVATIRRLTWQRNRLREAIDKVRHNLASVFNFSSHFIVGDRLVEFGISKPSFPWTDSAAWINFQQAAVTDCQDIVSSVTDSGSVVIGPDFEFVHAGIDRNSAVNEHTDSGMPHRPTEPTASVTSSSDADDSLLRTARADMEPGFCSVRLVLRMRDELFILRRHLYRTEERLSILRHVYSHVLIPAVWNHSLSLERRRLFKIRKLHLMFAARFKNYFDYVSGWDMGLV